MAQSLNVKIKKLPHFGDLELPKYETAGAACMDIRAALTDSITIKPGERKLVPTGICMAIPEGWEMQFRSRSSLPLKHGVMIMNSPGTVDSDYRGEIMGIMGNFGTEDFTIQHGDRIAQIGFFPITQATWQEVNELDETERGTGGYGSTGTA